MKRIISSFAAIILLAGLNLNLMAQNTENTAVAANIVTAISLTEVSSLHFGTMTIPTGDVSVVLSTATVRTATVPANITLLAQAPVAQNAAYTVAGTANATYTITLPANGTVTINDGGVNNMDVNDFVAESASDGAGTTGTLDGLGADSFVIGATLELTNGQAPGLYSGTFDVTVNYN